MKKYLIYTVPNSRTNEVKELGVNVLKVKVAAPPIRGRANEELIKLLAKHFKVHKSSVILLKGLTDRKKIFGIGINE